MVNWQHLLLNAGYRSTRENECSLLTHRCKSNETKEDNYSWSMCTTDDLPLQVRESMMSMHGLQTDSPSNDWVHWSISPTCYCHLVTGKRKTHCLETLQSRLRTDLFLVICNSEIEKLAHSSLY